MMLGASAQVTFDLITKENDMRTLILSLMLTTAANAYTFTEAVPGWTCSYSNDVCQGYDPASINSAQILHPAPTGLIFNVTLTINGIAYTEVTQHQGMAFTMTAPGQPSITATVDWIVKRTGNTGHFVTHYFITDGTVQ